VARFGTNYAGEDAHESTETFFLTIAIFAAVLRIDIRDVHASEQIVLATGEWAPYSSEAFLPIYGSYGAVAEIVEAVFRRAGFSPTFSFNGFGPGYNIVRDGGGWAPVIAGFPYFKTERRAEETEFSDSIMSVTDVIFYNRKVAPELGNIRNVNDLRKYRDRARFVASYCYHPDIEEALDFRCRPAGIEMEADQREMDAVREIETEIDAFRALADGTAVVILPATEAVGVRILQTLFPDLQSSIGVISSLRWRRDIHLIAPKTVAGREVVVRFNQELRTLKASPEYEKMRGKTFPVLLASRLVQLHNPGDFPIVVGREAGSARTVTDEIRRDVIIPRGTAALVVKWSRNFMTTQRGGIDLRDELQKETLVKVVNGPLAGRLLWVKNMYIEIPAVDYVPAEPDRPLAEDSGR
jgi:hypothetical protein